jgi:hypothetical protein
VDHTPKTPAAQGTSAGQVAQAGHVAQPTQAAQFEQALRKELGPWQQAIGDPATAQEAVLRRHLADFAKTRYGADHHAETVAASPTTSPGSADAARAQAALIAEYRRNFPIMTYADYKPLIDQVMKGHTSLLLWEDPIGWAITRGTTENRELSGWSTERDLLSRAASSGGRGAVLQLPVKFIPMTPTDLHMRVSAGRAMMAYVAVTKRFDLFAGANLNLNFPSVVGHLKVGGRDIEYGYSSGIYTKHVSRLTPIRSVPSQEEIDQLSPGTTRAEWDARFELAIEKCRDENVTLVGGVCQTAFEFGKYMRRKHGVYPKQLWKTQIMTLGSTPGINTKHAARLTAMYGPAAIREIYGATEGMFGQQLDERRAWAPNYDLFFFEVLTRSGIKMLHEMKPGETGSLVVTTPILARYRIGDMILAVRPPYFRCIGRESDWWTKPYYWWNEVSSLNLGRL